MPAVTRLGDMSTGHGCFPPKPNIEASPDVFANFIPVHRQGDAFAVHCCGKICHGSVLSAGSPTVFVNFKQIGRIGDPISCGDTVAVGSPNVFAGDSGGAGGGDTKKQDIDLAVKRTYGLSPEHPVISGPEKMYLGQTQTFKISNFDKMNQYSVVPVDGGTVSIEGNTITLTAPVAMNPTTGFKIITKGPDYDGFGSISIAQDGTFIGRKGEVLGMGIPLPSGELAYIGTDYKALLGLQSEIAFFDGVVGYLREGVLVDAYGKILGQIEEDKNNAKAWILQTKDYGFLPLTELKKSGLGFRPYDPPTYNFSLQEAFAPEVKVDSIVKSFGKQITSKPDLSKERNDNPLDYYVYTDRNYVPVGESKFIYKKIQDGSKHGRANGIPPNSNMTFSGGDVWDGYRKPGAPGGSLTVEDYQYPQTIEDVHILPLEPWPLEIILPEEIISLCFKQMEFQPVLRGILLGHTFWWEQIKGESSSVTWLSPRDQPTVAIDFGDIKVDRVFRFWADKGTSYEQHVDVTVYGTPIEKSYSSNVRLSYSQKSRFLGKHLHNAEPILLTRQYVKGMNIKFGLYNNL